MHSERHFGRLLFLGVRPDHNLFQPLQAGLVSASLGAKQIRMDSMRCFSVILGASALVLAACGGGSDAPEVKPETPAATAPVTTAANEGEIMEAGPRLAAILDAQPDEVKARYQYRHPRETIEFFGIEPGMTVAEIIPGGGIRK